MTPVHHGRDAVEGAASTMARRLGGNGGAPAPYRHFVERELLGLVRSAGFETEARPVDLGAWRLDTVAYMQLRDGVYEALETWQL